MNPVNSGAGPCGCIGLAQQDVVDRVSFGFQGKLCIHPSQVAAANRLFAPAPDEAAFCRRVVVADVAAAVVRGSASITVDGVLVDYPIAEKADRIIRLAETLAAKASSLSPPGRVE